ncbi:Uncharacterised protein [Klebsiella pneumoniae]|uniref:Uncharacterized protein n=1 Tax=Klebsiella pneumoniae TaxID=573 RepID=A0A2X1QPF3_KLEPN|nr:Uncharacterised protein [Klebsiella pneumoniae]
MAGSGGPARSVKHRTGHGEVDVLANQVRQRQRSHREAAAVTQSGIDNLRGGDLLFQRPPGLSVERTRYAVNDKTGR